MGAMRYHSHAIPLLLLAISAGLAAAEQHVDVCVYGGTASGVIAAAAAADEGMRVLVIEPSRHLGGMTGGGIGTIDYGARAAVGGLTHRFFEEYHPSGAPSQTRLEGGLKELLAKRQVTVIHEWRLSAVKRAGARITAIELEHAPPERMGAPAAKALADAPQVVTARVFIDASYEGDLMARAGVSYAVGRESAETYHERFAGRQPPLRIFPVDPWRIPGQPDSGLLPLVTADDGKPVGAADDGIPACNFRLQLSADADDREPFPEPTAYDPLRYEILGRWLASQPATDKPLRLPFAIYGKREFNDDRDQLVSLALIGGLHDYVDGDWAARNRVWREHEEYTFGLVRFLATDARVPAALRAEMAKWGLRRSAFPARVGA